MCKVWNANIRTALYRAISHKTTQKCRVRNTITTCPSFGIAVLSAFCLTIEEQNWRYRLLTKDVIRLSHACLAEYPYLN